MDAHGNRIDDDRLERIEALAIPPAWRDVWISPNASARLQATGVDRAGRRQYLYGITTLTKRHVSVRGQRIRFQYRGKHGILVRTTLVDDELADALRAFLRLEGGSRLLRFDRDGTLGNVTGPVLNAYIGEHLAPGFTAKDFRTWGGTLTAAVALAEHGPPGSAAEERRVLAAVMRRVGGELGNTPAVARASYVSPAVIEQWRDGRTLERFRERRLRVVSGRDTALLAEEAALLSLLRSWRIRRSRAA